MSSSPSLPSKATTRHEYDDESQHSDDDDHANLLDRSSTRRGSSRRKPLTWLEVVWATATVLLISTIAFSSQIFIILPYYRNTDTFTFPQLLLLLVPFNFGVSLIFYNYYLCVKTNPGQVPPSWEPDWTALDPSAEPGRVSTIELKTYAHKPRYCKSCDAYKPPRSHHCKTCGRCVLRMDHHCPWVANCVGYHNYGHFIRFLAMVDLTCTYHLVMISMRVMDRWNAYSYWREPSTREIIFLVINYALCIPVLLLVGIFSIYHFYCLCINQTTIESWEKDKVQTMIRRGKIRKVKYPYNVGVVKNVKAVLGNSPIWWCVPQNMAGDGLLFEVADGIGKSRRRRRGLGTSDLEEAGSEESDSNDELDINPEAEGMILRRLRRERQDRRRGLAHGPS